MKDCIVRLSELYTLTIQRKIESAAPESDNLPVPLHFGEDDVCIRLWMPLFHGLNDLILYASSEVRSIALDMLYEVLIKHGDTFKQSFWSIVASKIIIPQFIDITSTTSPKRFDNIEDDKLWISTTAMQAMGKFVELFTAIKTMMFLYPQISNIIKMGILFDNENVSRVASKLLQQLIEKNCLLFSEDEWKTTLTTFQELFLESMPTFLFFDYREEDQGDVPEFKFLTTPLGPPPDKIKFKSDIRYCSTHILAIQTLTEVLSLDLIFKYAPNSVAKEFLDCFYKSYEVAKAFNDCMELRDALYRKGYMKQLPNLQKQETLSVNAFITFQFEFYKSINDPQVLSKLFPYYFELIIGCVCE